MIGQHVDHACMHTVHTLPRPSGSCAFLMFVLIGASDSSDAPIARLTEADCHHGRQAIDW